MSDRWYQLTAGLRHYLRATSRFSLHSPFLHDLSETVFLPAKKGQDAIRLKQLRKGLYQDKQQYQKREYGAKANQNRPLTVGVAARKISIPQKYGRLLSLLIHKLSCQEVLELGTGMGMGTAYLMEGLKDQAKGHIATMEGCPETLKIANEHWQSLPKSWPTPECYQGELSVTLPSYTAQYQPDFVFLDAHHEKTAVRSYTSALLKSMAPCGVMVLDDIHWSSGMAEAWYELQAHKNVSMTVDLFRMGLVFTDPRLSPIHLRLRF